MKVIDEKQNQELTILTDLGNLSKVVNLLTHILSNFHQEAWVSVVANTWQIMSKWQLKYLSQFGFGWRTTELLPDWSNSHSGNKFSCFAVWISIQMYKTCLVSTL